jgi:hypothetical protein
MKTEAQQIIEQYNSLNEADKYIGNTVEFLDDVYITPDNTVSENPSDDDYKAQKGFKLHINDTEDDTGNEVWYTASNESGSFSEFLLNYMVINKLVKIHKGHK